MEYVKEKLLFCQKCKIETRHYKNAQKINWLMHLVLSILTFGIWVPVAIFYLFLQGLKIEDFYEKYVCSQCGNVTIKKDGFYRVVFYIVVLLLIMLIALIQKIFS